MQLRREVLSLLLIGQVTMLATVGQTKAPPQPTSATVAAKGGTPDATVVSEFECWKALLWMLGDHPKGISRETRHATILRSGLSEEQISIVFDAANSHAIFIHERLRKTAQIKAQSPRPIPEATLAQIRALFSEIDEDVLTQRRWLEVNLTPDSYRKLTDYVNTVVRAESSFGR